MDARLFSSFPPRPQARFPGMRMQGEGPPAGGPSPCLHNKDSPRPWGGGGGRGVGKKSKQANRHCCDVRSRTLGFRLRAGTGAPSTAFMKRQAPMTAPTYLVERKLSLGQILPCIKVLRILKALPHNDDGADAPSEISSDETKFRACGDSRTKEFCKI